MFVTFILFEFPDPSYSKDAVNALRVGLKATIRRYPFLAGNIRLSDERTGRVALEYPDIISDEIIDKMFTSSYRQVGSLDLDFTEMQKTGFPPAPIWRDVFCPVALKKHPGLDDDFAAGLISFKKKLPVPILNAQVTFIRGGLVLSVYSHHSAMDGVGIAQVYKIWSNYTRSQDMEPMAPISREPDEVICEVLNSRDHSIDRLAEMSEVTDCPEIRFPGTPLSAPVLRENSYKLDSKIFAFSATEISELANTLSLATNKQISSFVALVSLMWTTIVSVRSTVLAEKKIRTVKLGMAVDHRKTLNEHIDALYLGNCATEFQASCQVSTMLVKNSDNSVNNQQLSIVASTIANRLRSVTLEWLKPRLSLLSRTSDSWQLRNDADVSNGADLFVTSWMHIGTGCAWNIPGTTSEGPIAFRKPQSHTEGLMHILPKLRMEDGSPTLEVLVCLEESELEGVVRRLQSGRWDARVISA